MKKGKKLSVVLMTLAFLSSMTFANGLNLNSMGARAIAMGGAFVGLADDYSAVFWNPAGIAQFKQKTFGFSGDDIIPSGTYKFDFVHPVYGTAINVDAKSVTKHYLAGIAAYYHPVSENLVAGIAVYTPSGLGAEWAGTDFAPLSYGTAYEWMSKIGVVTVSPVLAYKISEQVYIGATLNINYGMFDISTHAGGAEAINPYTGQLMIWDFGQQTMELSGWGYGATFGILVKPSEMFSMGATFRTPTKLKFKGDATISKFNALATIPRTPVFGATIPTTSEVEGEVTWPMWICGGIAFKPVKNLTLTADVQYTNWKKIDVIEFEFTEPLWQTIMAESEGNKMEMEWKDATQFRFGAEYVINNFALRGGYYIDPAPAPDKTMNVLVPNYDFNVVTFGFGYSLEGFHLDLALEYLMGKDRDIPFSFTEELEMPGLYTMKIWAASLGMGYSW